MGQIISDTAAAFIAGAGTIITIGWKFIDYLKDRSHKGKLIGSLQEIKSQYQQLQRDNKELREDLHLVDEKVNKNKDKQEKDIRELLEKILDVFTGRR